MKKLNLLVLFFVSLFFISNYANATVAISPLKHELTVSQGQTVSKKIKVTNEGNSPITLYTSAEDFISGDSTGQPKFIKPEDQDSPELSLANWVKISEKNITLTVGETREIDFSITVPANGEPGGHYGAIFFSPGIQGDGKVAFSQRIGVLMLIDVPGEIVIDGNLEKFTIGEEKDGVFTEKNSFQELPAVFQVNFKNKGNIHLKPEGKIELIDEEGNILKNVGMKTISTPTGTFIGEELVDYIPVNDIGGSVLPNSDRNFLPKWEGFGYTVLNEDGTKTVEFKGLTEYYKDKASEKQAYLMFREQIHTKKVTKKITADYKLFYESKDKEKKEFNDSKDFLVEYYQDYVGLNYYVIAGVVVIILTLAYFIMVIIPKNKTKKEEELRAKIMKEMKDK